MFRALRPESSAEIEQFINIDRIDGSGTGIYGGVIFVGSLEYSSSGFNDKYHFISRVAIKGAQRRLPTAVEGFVTPHNTNQWVNIHRLTHVKDDNRDLLRTYDFEEPQTDVLADLLIPGVARALFDTANGAANRYPQTLIDYQDDLNRRTLEMLDRAIIRADNR